MLANISRDELYYKTGEAINIHCRKCESVQDSYSGPNNGEIVFNGLVGRPRELYFRSSIQASSNPMGCVLSVH